MKGPPPGRTRGQCVFYVRLIIDRASGEEAESFVGVECRTDGEEYGWNVRWFAFGGSGWLGWELEGVGETGGITEESKMVRNIGKSAG